MQQLSMLINSLYNTYRIYYRFFCLSLCQSSICINHTKSKTQTKSVSKFNPLCYISIINIIIILHQDRTSLCIRSQYFDSCIEFLKELLVNLRLLIKSCTHGSATKVDIRNRTISISYTMHTLNLNNISKSTYFRSIQSL